MEGDLWDDRDYHEDDVIGWSGECGSLTVREVERLIEARLHNLEIKERDPAYQRLLFARWPAEHHYLNEWFEPHD